MIRSINNSVSNWVDLRSCFKMGKVVFLLVIYILQFLLPVELLVVKLQSNSVYIVKNEEYPKNYTNEGDIEWLITSPQNTSLYVACRLQMPDSINCNSDHIGIYIDNGPQNKYCFRAKISTDTETNSIKIVFHANEGTSGGKYRCRIKAIETNLDETQSCECGWKLRDQARILGGNYTKVNEFPSMAYLLNPQTGQWPGAANIIAEKYALTAAHVVYRKTGLSLIVGDYNITSEGETQYYARYEIEQFIIHPKFNQNTSANDIAIVQTKIPIAFSYYVGPVCLPFRFKLRSFATEKVLALGWGLTHPNGTDSDALRKVELTVMKQYKCVDYYQPSVRRSEICTVGKAGKDPCDGDSGGPILWEDPDGGRLFLIGIIESGDSCGTGIPSVNTRVTSFLAWILSVIDDVKFCVK